MPLIGLSASDQRKTVAREGLLVSIIGAVLGASVGTILTAVAVSITMANGFIPRGDHLLLEPVVIVPVVAVVLPTRLGSRRVLDISSPWR